MPCWMYLSHSVIVAHLQCLKNILVDAHSPGRRYPTYPPLLRCSTGSTSTSNMYFPFITSIVALILVMNKRVNQPATGAGLQTCDLFDFSPGSSKFLQLIAGSSLKSSRFASSNPTQFLENTSGVLSNCHLQRNFRGVFPKMSSKNSPDDTRRSSENWAKGVPPRPPQQFCPRNVPQNP